MLLRNLILALANIAIVAAQNAFGILDLNGGKSTLPDPVVAGVKIEEPSGPPTCTATTAWIRPGVPLP